MASSRRRRFATDVRESELATVEQLKLWFQPLGLASPYRWDRRDIGSPATSREGVKAS
jgi:hypothetical protein